MIGVGGVANAGAYAKIIAAAIADAAVKPATICAATCLTVLAAINTALTHEIAIIGAFFPLRPRRWGEGIVGFIHRPASGDEAKCQKKKNITHNS